MSKYLEKNINKWCKKGLISKDEALKMLADVKQRKNNIFINLFKNLFKFLGILLIIILLLLGFAFIEFPLFGMLYTENIFLVLLGLIINILKYGGILYFCDKLENYFFEKTLDFSFIFYVNLFICLFIVLDCSITLLLGVGGPDSSSIFEFAIPVYIYTILIVVNLGLIYYCINKKN